MESVIVSLMFSSVLDCLRENKRKLQQSQIFPEQCVETAFLFSGYHGVHKKLPVRSTIKERRSFSTGCIAAGKSVSTGKHTCPESSGGNLLEPQKWKLIFVSSFNHRQ
jgi:hypothetical protein